MSSARAAAARLVRDDRPLLAGRTGANDLPNPHLSVLPGPPLGHSRYASSMTTDLRPCPFCCSSDLTIATATDGEITTVAIVCLECGSTGPKGTGGDPPGHVEFMWNQRFGTDQ